MVEEHRPDSPSDETGASARVSELFRNYLRSIGDDEDVDPADYFERAGEAAPELRRRIRVLEDLQAIREALSTDDEGDLPTEEPEVHALGRFQDLQLLGAGGLSRVFLAFDPELGRNVALKVFSAAMRAEEDSRSWTLSEARMLARLTHPGIVRVFDIGEAEGMDFIAMEFVDGPSLHEVIDELRRQARSEGTEGTPPPAQASRVRQLVEDLRPLSARCRVVAEIARALDYGHQSGVVHRDVKPGNVLLESAERPKLIDFGLASFGTAGESLTHVTQRLVGTAPYIAPEQVRSGQTGADQRSDIFSLGIVLYELLSLENPFIRPTQGGTLDAIAKARPPRLRAKNPDVPEDLERICHHCLEADPEDRYSTMAAVAADIEAFLDHRAISVQPPSLAKLAKLWLQRNQRAVRVTSGSLALLLAVGLTLAALSARQARTTALRHLARIETELQDTEDEPSFDGLYRSLAGLRQRAVELDSAWPGNLVGPGVGPRSAEVAVLASRRLAAVFEGIRTEKPEAVPRDDWPRTWVPHWRRVLDLDKTLVGPGSPVAEYHDRGRLRLAAPPTGGELHFLRHVVNGKSIAHTLVPADPHAQLYRGYYRLEARSGAGHLVGETEFFLDQADPLRTLTGAPPAPEFTAQALLVTGGVVGTEKRPIAVDPFQISSAPVTWRELISVLGEEGEVLRQAYQRQHWSWLAATDGERKLVGPRAVRSFLGLFLDAGAFLQGLPHPRVQLAFAMDLDAPARVSHANAERFAVALHARLPYAHELQHARHVLGDRFEIPTADPPAAQTPWALKWLLHTTLRGEWTCSTTSYRDDLRSRFDYVGMRFPEPKSWVSAILEADWGGGTTFRLASSVLPETAR